MRLARTIAFAAGAALFGASAGAEPPAKIAPQDGEKVMSGMSIVGNDEAPKSLVIVPWKSSDLGDEVDFRGSLDGTRQPVDREVFMRELTYYEIRVGR